MATAGATHRRPSQPRSPSSSTFTAGALPGQDTVQPGPSPKPIGQLLAFGLIIFLGLLQFLPATHFRHPLDRQRNWIPFEPNTTNFGEVGTSNHRSSGLDGGKNAEDGFLHVVSWMDCSDLQVVAVLMNSTLSSSSYPNLVFFHFFIPGGDEDKVPFYKLKVLFPDSNLEIHGKKEIDEILKSAFHGVLSDEQDFEVLVPFVVPRVFPSLGKFVYVSANMIMKGKVEELIALDLKNYAVAAAKDCSERLETCLNSDVLDAVQRSASKPWVSDTPYARGACVPDLNVLVIDTRKFEAEFLDAIRWWSKVLNLNNSPKIPAVALALYGKFLELPSSWLVKDSASSVDKDAVIHYDGPRNLCRSSSLSTTLPVIPELAGLSPSHAVRLTATFLDSKDGSQVHDPVLETLTSSMRKTDARRRDFSISTSLF